RVAHRDVAGLLGTDAHGGLRAGGFHIPFPDHRRVFGLASQYLLLPRPLTGEATSDTRRVLEAMRQGRGYLGVDALGDASAFSFQAIAAGGHAGPGEDPAPSGPPPLLPDARGLARARLVPCPDRHPGAPRPRPPPLPHRARR